MLVSLFVACALSVHPIATDFTWPVKPFEKYRKDQEVFDLFVDDFGINHGYHFGEDWNRIPREGQNGNVDLGDSVYCIGNGKVVRVDLGTVRSWGKVIVISHILPNLEIVYSIYAHLQDTLVVRGQEVLKGGKIGTIGDANGAYPGKAHLHFAIKKRGPFPPNVKAYEKVLEWERINEYYIPTLFISNRQNSQEISLNLLDWTNFVVAGQTPVSTAYVEVTPFWGEKQYYSLENALRDDILKPVIRRYRTERRYTEIRPDKLENFIFDPKVFSYSVRVSNTIPLSSSRARLVLFPVNSDPKIMALRAKSDLFWSAQEYGPEFIRPKPETFFFGASTWTDGEVIAYIGTMDFETIGIPSHFWHWSSVNAVPLLGRDMFYPWIEDGIYLPPVSPNKVD